jgi:hypothetical protein
VSEFDRGGDIGLGIGHQERHEGWCLPEPVDSKALLVEHLLSGCGGGRHQIGVRREQVDVSCGAFEDVVGVERPTACQRKLP